MATIQTPGCGDQSPANTSPQFTDYDDDDLYFRTAPSDILQGQVLADLMVADGVANAAILARQDSYGEGLLNYTKAPFEEQGGEVVLDQVYDPEAHYSDVRNKWFDINITHGDGRQEVLEAVQPPQSSAK